MNALKQFANQQYLNIETFRKNGQGVKTPVWFAQEGETLYIWTESSSGKAKRVRNNSTVNVAPSRGDGAVLGQWSPASASRDDSPESIEKVNRLFAKKYGFAFHAFVLLGKLRKAQHTTLKINFQN
jgi:uncharacterized protein